MLEVLTSPSTAKGVRALEAGFRREGVPERLLTDRGVQFTGGEFQAFVERHGVTHTRTSPAHQMPCDLSAGP